MRRLVIILSSFAMIVMLLVIASLVPLNKTLGSPSYIKSSLVKTNFYDNLLSSLDLTSAQKTDLPTSTPSEVDKELEVIIKKVFTPTTFQNTTEAVVDGTFNWLQGKTALPQFSIDLTEVKSKLITEISAYLKSQFASLPVCTDATNVNFNITKATCKPIGLTLDDNTYTQEATNMINEVSFLDKGQVTFGSLGADSKATIWQTAPKYYHWANIIPVILTIITLIGIGVTILFCRNRWHAVKIISHIFNAAGGSLLLGGIVLALIVAFGISAIPLPAGQAALVGDVILPLLKNYLRAIDIWMFGFAASYLTIGIGSYLAYRQFYKKPQQAAQAVAAANLV